MDWVASIHQAIQYIEEHLRDRTENVRIHRDAHQHGQDNAEGIAAAQNGLNP